jgi:hypothetical protein
MVFSFLFALLEFLSVVILFFTHQKGPHPFGNEDQDDTADKTVDGVKTDQPFPVMIDMAMDDKIQKKQDKTTRIESVQ